MAKSVNSLMNMLVKVTGKTIGFDVQHNLYFVNSRKIGKRPHDYIGLYEKGSVRYVGKITACVEAYFKNGDIQYNVKSGVLTKERETAISTTITSASSMDEDLTVEPVCYYFVDKFHTTDFRKREGFLRCWQYIDLAQVLGATGFQSTAELAKLLRNQTW